MAESFHLSTDLKQLLKVKHIDYQDSSSRQNVMADTKNVKKLKCVKEFEITDGRSDAMHQQDESFTKSSSTHTNSNGNALLTHATVNQQTSTESLQKRQKGTVKTSSDHQSAALPEQGPNDHRHNTLHTSIKSSKKKKSEKLKSLVYKMVNNTSGERMSEVKTGNIATAAVNRKNPKDSSNYANHSRNSSSNRGQQNDCQPLNTGAEGTRKDQHSKTKSVASYSNNVNKQRQSEEMELSSEFLLLLEENKIFTLKKKKQKFPKAKFFCRLCDYHLDLKEDCDKHIKDSRHCRRKELNEVDSVLRNLAKPTEAQLTALTAAVEDVYEMHGLNESEQKERTNIVSRLEEVLKEKIPDVIIFMYGSSLTGFGLKTADINVDLTSADKSKKLTSLLKEVHHFLKDRTDSGFCNVRPDFAATVPGLLMTDNLTSLTVNVAIHCYHAHCSSELLSIYSVFDTRVKKLAVAFRYWAHLCWLDQKRDGFIPPQALNLMVIYFLQTINPQAVPTIRPPRVSADDVGDYSKDSPKFEKLRIKVLNASLSSHNTMSLGELWLGLLKFYSLEFDSANVVVSIYSDDNVSRHKSRNSKKLAVEDPYLVKNITRMVNNSQVYEYWQDSIRRALYYFGLPRDLEGKTDASVQDLKKIMRDSTKKIQAEQNKQEGAKRVDVNEIKKGVVMDRQNNESDSRKDKAIVDEDCNIPVVIAPNPLLACRIPSSIKKSGHKVLKLDEHFSCGPQILSDEGLPSSMDGQNGPPVLSDSVPQVLTGKSGLQVQTGDCDPKVCDDESVPQVLSSESGPHILSDERGPQMLSYESGPQILSDESGPQILSDESGPQVQSGESGPQVQSGESGPQVQSGESGKLVPRSESGPQVMSNECGPQVLNESGLQLLNGESGPQVPSDECGPQFLSSESLKQVRSSDETGPQFLCDDCKPQIADVECEPKVQNGENEPNIQTIDVVSLSDHDKDLSSAKSTNHNLMTNQLLGDFDTNSKQPSAIVKDIYNKAETTAPSIHTTIPIDSDSLSTPASQACHLDFPVLPKTVDKTTSGAISLVDLSDIPDLHQTTSATNLSQQEFDDVHKFALSYAHSVIHKALSHIVERHIHSLESDIEENGLTSDEHSLHYAKHCEGVVQSAEASISIEAVTPKSCLLKKSAAISSCDLNNISSAQLNSMPSDINTQSDNLSDLVDVRDENLKFISNLSPDETRTDILVTSVKEIVVGNLENFSECQEVSQRPEIFTENLLNITECQEVPQRPEIFTENLLNITECQEVPQRPEIFTENLLNISECQEVPQRPEIVATGLESIPESQEMSQRSELVTESLHCSKKVSEYQESIPESQEVPRNQEDNSILAQSYCFYEFSETNLTDGKGPVLLCTYCEKEGHLKSSCPEDGLPEVLPLPQLTPHHVNILSETLSKVPAEVGLSEESLMEREMFMKSLEAFIQVQIRDAKLALFGSSCNGFGFDKSDMDICLTFTHKRVIEKSWLIEVLAKRLKQHVDLTNVQAIPTAKVPIVKFTVKKTNLDGDISLYNILAQQNTKLLMCYSKIDPRVSILGYTIKTFAKVCDIGDASRGSLSSYAYILMMLYYLQQVNPPVIPVLQELYKDKEKPKLIIEEWNAWFMDDLSLLDELWPEKGKNQSSVAELWLGFLCFYVEEFKYKEYVISIRQKEKLTRFEKLWNGSCLAIEDPFDLNHNLGSGLTKKMHNFILKTFINGRMLYGSPIDDNIEMFNKYQSASDYFFDTDLLSECRPPNVRGCRRCGKIGHLVRHCPSAHKDKEEEQKRLQQQQQAFAKENQDYRLNGPATNVNRNASTPSRNQGMYTKLTSETPTSTEPPQLLLFNMARLMMTSSLNNPQTIENHPNLQLVVPAALRGLNPTFSQMNRQQHQPSMMINPHPVWLPPSIMPSHSMFAAPHTRSNQYNYAPPGNPQNMYFQPRYPSGPPSFGNWHHQNNNQRRPQQHPSPNYSGYDNNNRGMNPRLHNMYAGTREQFPEVGSNLLHKRK